MSKNEITLEFTSLIANIALARLTAAAFASQIDFTIQDIDEIKMAVSEAVTNAIIHGYHNSEEGKIVLNACIINNELEIIVADDGCGIRDIQQALSPAFSGTAERMGMGFTFMQTFMDHLQVSSQPGLGTEVRMIKSLPVKNKLKDN